MIKHNHSSYNNNDKSKTIIMDRKIYDIDIQSEELGRFNLFDIMCDDSEHRQQFENLSDEFSPIDDYDVLLE